jgi:hypothetical protein
MSGHGDEPAKAGQQGQVFEQTGGGGLPEAEGFSAGETPVVQAAVRT